MIHPGNAAFPASSPTLFFVPVPVPCPHVATRPGVVSLVQPGRSEVPFDVHALLERNSLWGQVPLRILHGLRLMSRELHVPCCLLVFLLLFLICVCFACLTYFSRFLFIYLFLCIIFREDNATMEEHRWSCFTAFVVGLFECSNVNFLREKGVA